MQSLAIAESQCKGELSCARRTCCRFSALIPTTARPSALQERYDHHGVNITPEPSIHRYMIPIPNPQLETRKMVGLASRKEEGKNGGKRKGEEDVDDGGGDADDRGGGVRAEVLAG